MGSRGYVTSSQRRHWFFDGDRLGEMREEAIAKISASKVCFGFFVLFCFVLFCFVLFCFSLLLDYCFLNFIFYFIFLFVFNCFIIAE